MDTAEKEYGLPAGFPEGDRHSPGDIELESDVNPVFDELKEEVGMEKSYVQDSDYFAIVTSERHQPMLSYLLETDLDRYQVLDSFEEKQGGEFDELYFAESEPEYDLLTPNAATAVLLWFNS
ncbi:MAG: hypothetical protein ABEJ83_02355 [Candidatus Nanohaloarchaea archaeon]